MLMIRALASSTRFPLGWASTIGDGWNGAEVFGEALREPAQQKAFLDHIAEFCEKNCVVRDASSAAKLEPAHRKTLTEWLGQAGLESVAIAAEPGRVLWSDDGVADHVAGQFLNAPRIWTQAVFGWSVAQGKIDPSRFNEVSARLIGFGYMFTGCDHSVLFECGRQAEWKFDRWPLRQGISRLGHDTMRLEAALGMGARLIAKAYLALLVPEDRRNLLISLVTAIGRRGDLREARLNEFRQVLIREFGPINVVLRRDAVETFDAWRRGRGVLRR